MSITPEKLNAESKKNGPDTLVAFRAESAKRINQALESFYQKGTISELENLFVGTSKKVPEAVRFVAEAFRGKVRKDGSHLAVHSLQLFQSAQHLGVFDDAVLLTALLHDLGEDAGISSQTIGKRFGDDIGAYADIMTERRISGDRRHDLALFAKQVKRGGRVSVMAEIIDRIDDISDIGYLTKGYKQDVSDQERRAQTLQALAKKFAQCKFTVETITAGTNDPDVMRLKQIFFDVFEYQKNLWNIPEDQRTPYIENKERKPVGLKITLIRHAATEYNKQKKKHKLGAGDPDPLTGKGIVEYQQIAEEIARSISPDEKVIVYSSGFERARSSGDILIKALKKNHKTIKKHGLFKTKETKILTDMGKLRNWNWKAVYELLDGGEAVYRGKKFFIDSRLTNPHQRAFTEFFMHGGIQKALHTRGATKGWPKGFIKELQSMETYFEVTKRMITELRKIKNKYAGEKYRVIIVTHRALMYFLGDFFTEGAKIDFEPGESIELEERGEGLVVTKVGTRAIENEADIFKTFQRTKSKVKKGKTVITIGNVLHRATGRRFPPTR